MGNKHDSRREETARVVHVPIDGLHRNKPQFAGLKAEGGFIATEADKYRNERITKYDLDNRFGHSVHGYALRHIEAINHLNQIPEDVLNLIWIYLPKLLRFELFNEKKFKLSKKGSRLDAISANNQDYQIYPEALSKTGMDRGVYCISFRTFGPSISYSVGIKSVRKKEWTQDTEKMFHKKEGLYYYLRVISDEDITMRLDCTRWCLSYYSGRTLLREQPIHAASYFFAVHMVSKSEAGIEIIETAEALAYPEGIC